MKPVTSAQSNRSEPEVLRIAQRVENALKRRFGESGGVGCICNMVREMIDYYELKPAEHAGRLAALVFWEFAEEILERRIAEEDDRSTVQITSRLERHYPKARQDKVEALAPRDVTAKSTERGRITYAMSYARRHPHDLYGVNLRSVTNVVARRIRKLISDREERMSHARTGDPNPTALATPNFWRNTMNNLQVYPTNEAPIAESGSERVRIASLTVGRSYLIKLTDMRLVLNGQDRASVATDSGDILVSSAMSPGLRLQAAIWALHDADMLIYGRDALTPFYCEVAKGKVRCPYCDHAPMKTFNGLRVHVKARHGIDDWARPMTHQLYIVYKDKSKVTRSRNKQRK